MRHYLPGVKTHLSKAMFETSPGNYITGGIIVDSINGVYCNRLCIMGLGSQGQILWVKKYGNSKFQYLNNLFISRSFYKQGNYIYYTTCVLDSTNKYIGVLLKLDQNGDTIWQKIYRDPDPLEDVMPSMVTGSVDGGFLITGLFQNNGVTPYNRCMLIKTDANGNELWRKKIGKVNPDVNDGKSIIQDSASKKIVIVGYQYLPGNSNFDNVVITDSLGNQPQRYKYINILGGVLLDMIQTRDKKIVAVGQKLVPQSSGGTRKAFIVKFDLDTPASPIWMIDFDKTAAYNAFTCLTETNDGNILVGGYFDTLQLQNQNPNLLTRITKMNKNGAVLWKHYYNYKTNAPTSDNGQTLKSLNLTSDGGYVGAIECQNFPTPNPFFFVKWDSLGCDSTLAYCQAVAMGGGKNDAGSSEMSLYPNPGTGLFYISGTDMEAGGKQLRVIVSDLTGRTVKRVELDGVQREQVMDLNSLNNGVYVISVIREREVVYKGKVLKAD